MARRSYPLPSTGEWPTAGQAREIQRLKAEVEKKSRIIAEVVEASRDQASSRERCTFDDQPEDRRFIVSMITLTALLMVGQTVKTFAFYSAGGFARETRAGFLQSLGLACSDEFRVVFIDDDPAVQGSEIHGSRVISYDEALTIKDLKVNIAFAQPKLRREKYEQCERDGLQFFDSIAPTAIIGDNVKIGPAPIFSHNSMVTSDAKIGKAFHCNIYSYVAHDCIVGDFVTFAPRVSLNGRIKVEDGVYVGSDATLLPGRADRFLRIGQGAIIGAGAVVTKDVESFTTVVGAPAKPLETR